MIQREQIVNIWADDPVAVQNSTGSSIPAFKVLVASGVNTPTSPKRAVPTVEVLSSASQIPIAFSFTAIPNGQITDEDTDYRAGRRGVIQVIGLDTTGAAIGDKVYIDNSGNPTLAVTTLLLGVVLVLSTNGTIYVNLPAQPLSTGGGGGGGLTPTSVKTANYSAAASERIPVNSTAAGFNITLPATPTHGDEIEIADVAGMLETNAVTVLRNGNNINGVADDLLLDLNYSITKFVFFTGFGWGAY